MGASFVVGAHTLPYRADPLDRALEGIAAAGFTSVGLFKEHAGAPILAPRPTGAELTRLRHRVEDFGLTPIALFAGSSTGHEQALLVDIHTCSRLGIPILQAHGPWPFDKPGHRKAEMAWYGEVERFLAVLAAVASDAERAGVTIVLKPHGGATATGFDIVDVVGRIASPAVRACWDPGNIRYYEGLDSEDELELSGVAPLVRSVCIKDHSGPRGALSFPIPGNGDVDHRRMLKTLVAAGFKGPLLVERFDQPDAQANDAAMAHCFRFLQALVQQETDGEGD